MAQRQHGINELPAGGLDTPYGKLYRPLGFWSQAGALVGSFFATALLGHVTGLLPGDLSEAARGVTYVGPFLVFFVGYATWAARLHGLAVATLGWALLKALFRLVVFRKPPASVDEVLPSPEQLLKMAVSAQKAGASFTPAGWGVGVMAGLLSLLMDSGWGPFSRFALVTGACVAWGYTLSLLGRRGALPFPESE